MSSSSPSFGQRVVVLIHGLGANPLMMALLASRLRSRGYRTVNWGYWSVGKTIEKHGAAVSRVLAQFDQDTAVDEIFLVTHSMGGIVARAALQQEQPAKLHRMVMLTPPNQGSPWATWFGPWLKPICSTLDQLAERPDSFVNQLPPPHNLEVGIIAAGLDVLVPRHNTELPTQRDYHIMPGTMHTGILFRRSVVEQIDHFLRTGSFSRREQGIS